MNAVNSSTSCMAMDSACHEIRLLEWQYNLTVMENMCAIFLDREGGAKRNAMAKDAESTLSK